MSNLPAPEEPLGISDEQRGDVVILRLSGSASMDISDRLQDRLYEMADLPIKCLILDLSRLDFVSSAGLGAIIAAQLRCRQRNCEIKLVAPQPRILELLEVTRLTQLFGIFETVDEALAE